ncbi:MAG TPA: aminomethyl-transferring glycine dehydrogenase subunit GcvPA [Aggregatilinea sp.]|uniref:aminomethyl-transferring glycine dehydrogenase subunit GcvPA n=1 Tax=Aggregatilinea sp. TaxID=2806333 RepID=UPI002CD6E4C0|nr:aminomethyl-transferring glycine dehydrogenase subunit GcvPA [Aggregatilinea sp.]HML21513.1 aminomethyl-transferring glycine dehydrogenase subunit GcvPA [Aggregatilinea sp.]
MSYIPHTDADRADMLKTIGVQSMEELFDRVPDEQRFPPLDLPEGLSEMEVAWEVGGLARANVNTSDYATFLGAGAYNHYIPSIVNHVLLRSEFYTAYTPYQPEVSQGTLQAIFEYQSMMIALTGMEVANASHYDGATALAEAVTMARAHYRGKRTKVILSPGVNPQFRAVARTYHQGSGMKFVGDKGSATLTDLVDMLDDDTAMLVVSYPNFFGQIEDFSTLAESVHKAGALLCMVVDPIMLGLFKSPGELGADVVVGEGQSLGIPLSFGGPYLGFFATREEYVRKIAGRVVGQTVDNHGRRAYVMTLRPREQDIRREKATSNICTNQGLMSLAACVYMSAMGKHGLRKVAELCYQKSHYAAEQLNALNGYSVDMSKPFFKEFVLTCPRPVAELNDYLLEHWGIIGGYDLSKDLPGRENQMLVAVTEMNIKDEIDTLVEALRDPDAHLGHDHHH